MIEKLDLTAIISKYYLNGMIEAVRWEIKDNNIHIAFNAPTKDMIGYVESKNFPLEDSTIGISNTTQLNKLVAITNGYLNLEYKKQNKLITKLMIADNQYTLDYSLADLMIIPPAGVVKDEPVFSIFAEIDNESIGAIVKAKGALVDTDTVVIRPNPNADGEQRLELCFGGNIEHSNKVSFFLPDVNMSVDEFKEHYNSNMIKEIMYCNKDMTSGKMSIDLEGIMKLEFESDNIKSVYYVVAKEQ
jgi:hypothetical protein